MIKIATQEGSAIYEHLINPKYIVSMDELQNGHTQITMESGAIYYTTQNMYKIYEQIRKTD